MTVCQMVPRPRFFWGEGGVQRFRPLNAPLIRPRLSAR